MPRKPKAKMLMVEDVMGWLDLVPRTKGFFERAWEGFNHTFFGSPLLPTTIRPTPATPEPHFRVYSGVTVV